MNEICVLPHAWCFHIYRESHTNPLYSLPANEHFDNLLGELDMLSFCIFFLGCFLNLNKCAANDVEDLTPKPQGKTSGTVLPYVGVACLGAILFGYHLG